MFSRQKSSFKPFQALALGYNSNSHCDVEIKTQGGWKIHAHSFYLASCSKFLSRCLEDARPGALPTIYLPDVRPTIMQALLEFIYTGQVKLNQEEISEFFSTGRFLQIEAINKVSQTNHIQLPEMPVVPRDLPKIVEEGEISLQRNVIELDEDSDDSSYSNTNPGQLQGFDEQWNDTNVIPEAMHDVKKHQIVCPQNITFFRTKLQASMATLYASYDINMEINVKIELKMDPLSVKCRTKCPICRKPYNIIARVDRDKKRFIQWNTSKYRLHFKQKHSRSVEQTGVELPSDGLEFVKEEYEGLM